MRLGIEVSAGCEKTSTRMELERFARQLIDKGDRPCATVLVVRFPVHGNGAAIPLLEEPHDGCILVLPNLPQSLHDRTTVTQDLYGVQPRGHCANFRA